MKIRSAWLALPLVATSALAACGSDVAQTAGGGSTIPSGTSSGSPDPTSAPDGGVDGAVERPRIPGPGYGADVDPAGGVTFRVWAPHATAAAVVGDFPEGTATLKGVDGGVFEARVPGARAGHVYRFVLDGPAGKLTRPDPYCREIVDATTCRVVDPNAYAWRTASFARPSRAESVVYEMHVGSFTEEGTLAAAKAKLAGLADLGINVVELMPVHAFGSGPRSWGYNPQLWLAPKPAYGSADELRAFVDEAHARGIAVWADFVVNHADGWKQAPLRCWDGHCPDGAAGIFFFGPGDYASTPWGPRPNYTEPQVTRMLTASVEQWLVEYRADGFRWDSVSNIRALDGQGSTPGGKELIRAANARTHELGALSIAEDLKGWDGITKATSAGGLGFDAQWDGFGYDVVPVLANPSDDARDVGVIERALGGSYAGDAFARLLWVENHDTVGNGGARLPSRIDTNDGQSVAARRRAMLGGVLLLTAPGVPMLFMGQEGLATGTFTSPATVLPAPTAAGEKIRAFYKTMIGLRRTIPGLSKPGVEVFHKNDPAKVVAYRRGDAVVVVNLRNKAYTRYDVGVSSAGPWKVRLDTNDKAYGDELGDAKGGTITAMVGTKDGKPYTLPLELGPYSAMILTP